MQSYMGMKEKYIISVSGAERKNRRIFVEIEDFGKGIEDVEKAMEPHFYNKSGSGTIRHGIFLYGSIYG
mgnify:CR=1 FL=1